MARTPEEIKAQVLDYVNTNPGWNWNQWNDETYYFGLHHKFDFQLEALQVNYRDKLIRIYGVYREIRDILRFGVSDSFIQATSEDNIIDLDRIKKKVMRIARKWRAVNAEIEGRSRGFFGPGLTYNRVYHGTDYYIDLDNGNNGQTGLDAAGEEWLTIEQYTTTTARSPGDRAFVRAATDEVIAADFGFDEDGTADNPIYIIGCDSVINDPWSDSSDVKPILDANSAARVINVSEDYFWFIDRMSFKNSMHASGFISADRDSYLKLRSCEFIDNTIGGRCSFRGYVEHEDCLFEDNTDSGWRMLGGVAVFNSCEFDAGSGGGQWGIQSDYPGEIHVIDSSFGQSNAFSVNDIIASHGSVVYLRNVTHNNDFAVTLRSVIYSEDDDGVKGAQVTRTAAGTITRDTGVTRSGGATSSAKYEPNSGCGLFDPLCFGYDKLTFSDNKVWCAAALTTITIYIRSLGTWGTYPTADELYIEASYLDEAATSASRAKVQSNDVLSHASDWKAFDVTFTPVQAGWVYLNVFLKHYEDAGDGCYVDIKPVVT